MPLVLLSTSGHYDDQLIELTDEELQEVYRIEGEKFLFDTKEGRQKIKELKAHPAIPIVTITIYQ